MPLPDSVHQRLFDASPNAYLVLDRQLNIVTANRAYLASTGRTLDDIVGRWAWDAFPTDPETQRQAVASFERVIRTRQIDTMALLRFDIPRADSAGGGFETRYWTITHTPVFGADGEVEMVLQHPIDVTDIERMKGDARLADDQHAALATRQAGLLDHARQAFEANLDLKADVERLQALFQKAPSFMAVLRGPDHVFEFVNDAMRELFGRRDYLGLPARDALPEFAGQRVFETLDWVRGRGEAFIGYDLPVRVWADGLEDQRYLNLIYQPIVEHGEVAGIFVVGADVSEQNLARATVEAQVVRLQRAEHLLAFELELADCLRPLTSPEEVIAAASALLGTRLALGRVVFAEIDVQSQRIAVRRDWRRPGMAGMAGLDTTLDEFGPAMAAELRAGRDVLVDDVRLDPRTRAQAAAYEAAEVRAHMSIPLARPGGVHVLLSLHDSAPRAWTADELRMAQDTAARTWAAVEAAGAQAALRTERDESQYIFDTMTEGFSLVDRAWRVVRMNVTGLQMLRRDAGQIVGRNLWDAFPNAVGTEVEQLCRRVKASARADLIEYSYLRDDGATVSVEVRAFPALDGGLAIFFRDISARRHAEDALRRTAGQLRFTLDSARLGEWELDLVSGTSRRSPLHDRCFGYTEPVANWGLASFLAHVHPDDRAAAERTFREAVADNTVWRIELRVIWSDASVHWVSIFGTIYLMAGEVQRMAGIIFDISERKRIEEQLRLEAHRKDEFLAMLAHELRNPLAPIGAAADLLSMGGLDAARVRRTSAIITRQVGHMSSLIDDLLDVSRVTRGLVTLESTAVDVKGIIADAVEQVRPLIEARRHRLELQLAPEHAVVLGDRKRLVQVLANLLGNAAKYTPEGGRIALHMEVDDEPGLERVHLCVIDNGIGMTPEVQRGAFELFTQAERTPDRSQGGLGIGLALVKSLVELHRGSVTAHSEGPGRGSKFVVCLPRVAEAPGAPAAAEAAAHAPHAVGAGPRGVLVVDDNVDAAQLLAMVLENVGLQVTVEHAPHAALDAARTNLPAICILDIGLPDMDGNELARRMRALPGMEGALLIALTGYGRPQDREAALAAGFDHHLVKPVDLHQLIKLLG